MHIRTGLMIAGLLALGGPASAQTPVERGKYLVNTILTCQNCHTPKGERGRRSSSAICRAGSNSTSPRQGQGLQHHAGQGNRIGNWTIRHQTSAAEGRAANGVKLAAIMPRTSMKSSRRATSTRSSPICAASSR